MDWFYANDGRSIGPVREEELTRLATEGQVGPDTLVWREGMPDWQPYSVAAAKMGTASLAASANDLAPDQTLQRPLGEAPLTEDARCVCAECGNAFAPDEVIPLDGRWICGACKPLFLQRLREGSATRSFHFAGFWIRFVARVADGILLAIPNILISRWLTSMAFSMDDPFLTPFLMMGASLSTMCIAITYEVFFIGRFGATLGKMACGIRVVRSDGVRVSYFRAFGRYWATVVSGLLLSIGYIMAAFDDEKRALHDRMCDTRVVYSSKKG